jgi:hypothetical protein
VDFRNQGRAVQIMLRNNVMGASFAIRGLSIEASRNVSKER